MSWSIDSFPFSIGKMNVKMEKGEDGQFLNRLEEHEVKTITISDGVCEIEKVQRRSENNKTMTESFPSKRKSS